MTTIELERALNEIEKRYEKIRMADFTPTRRYNGERIIEMLNQYPELKNYWGYDENQFCWADRFYKVEERTAIELTEKHISIESHITIENHIVVDEEIHSHEDPSICGCYLVGSTNFNPHTGETFYWVKVGMSKDIHSRMSSYNTCCPQLFRIDYKKCNNSSEARIMEEVYQNLLSKVALGRCQHNAEWWLVDRETYLKICERKFDFFRVR